jgi:hypothetical protein
MQLLSLDFGGGVAGGWSWATAIRVMLGKPGLEQKHGTIARSRARRPRRSRTPTRTADKLAGPWVAETEHVWRSSSCANKQLEVDVRQVTGVDEAGRKLLSTMHQAGARLIAEGVAMTALIKKITAKQPFTDS